MLHDHSSDYDIELFARSFVTANREKIWQLLPRDWKTDSQIAGRAFEESALQTVRRSCYSYINAGHPLTDEERLANYLLASVANLSSQMDSTSGAEKQSVCAGCRDRGIITPISQSSTQLRCNECQNALNHTEHSWEEHFYQSFAAQSQSGVRCPDCDRFIPVEASDSTVCPYPDCMFVGSTIERRRAYAPKIRYRLDDFAHPEAVGQERTDTPVIVRDQMGTYLALIRRVIDEQLQILTHKRNSVRNLIRRCMYEAHRTMLLGYPVEMTSLLIFGEKSVIQPQIFQQFVRQLAASLPAVCHEDGRLVTIDHLTHPALQIFDGQSSFDAPIDSEGEIANLTRELYVGSRAATYCRPYFIGQLVDVSCGLTGRSLLPRVDRYSFARVYMSRGTPPGPTTVTHLRISPHPQMGGLSLLTKIRRLISERARRLLPGDQ